jgi:formate dehydrogenase subunit gamma
MDNSTVIAPEQLVGRHARSGLSLLAILHAIQDDVGYLPESVAAPLAKATNLSRAEVHGVITYYHHFRTQPAASVSIALCRAEACRSMGTEALAKHIQARTGCRFDGGHRDAVGLESVYCLGQCALSPAMMINGVLHARVTPGKFDTLLAAAIKRAEQPA